MSCADFNCKECGVYLQGRMNVVGRARGLPLWPPHSRIRVGRGCSFVSLGLAGTLLWDKARPGQSLLDSSVPRREWKWQRHIWGVAFNTQGIWNKQCGTSIAERCYKLYKILEGKEKESVKSDKTKKRNERMREWMNNSHFRTEEGMWSGGGEVKRAVETSSTGATGFRQTLSGAVTACRTGWTALHRDTSYNKGETEKVMQIRQAAPLELFQKLIN